MKQVIGELGIISAYSVVGSTKISLMLAFGQHKNLSTPIYLTAINHAAF